MASPTYDPFGNPYSIAGYTGGATPYGYSNSEEPSAYDITGAEMLAVIQVGLISRLKDDMEEAKLRCEDEEDDTSLGEYIAYQAVIERAEKFIREAAGSRFDREKISRAAKQYGIGNPQSARPYYKP